MSFDKRDIFESKFKEKMDEVRTAAIMEGLPFIASFAVSDDGETTEYKNYLVSATDAREPLTDDHLIEHANVIAGLKTTTNKEIEVDDSFLDEMMEDFPEE